MSLKLCKNRKALTGGVNYSQVRRQQRWTGACQRLILYVLRPLARSVGISSTEALPCHFPCSFLSSMAVLSAVWIPVLSLLQLAHCSVFRHAPGKPHLSQSWSDSTKAHFKPSSVYENDQFKTYISTFYLNLASFL